MRGEHGLQQTIVSYVAAALPTGAWFSAIDMASGVAGEQAAKAGGLRKARGAKAGLPDLIVCWQGRLIGLEIKLANGRLSPAQIACHEGMRAAGAHVAVVRNSYEVEAVLSDLGMPLRARHLVREEAARAGRMPAKRKAPEGGSPGAPK